MAISQSAEFFFNRPNKVALLEPQQERDLAERMRRGTAAAESVSYSARFDGDGREAFETFVQANLPLLVHDTGYFTVNYNSDRDDLVQAGAEALMRSVCDYDTSYGTKLVTLANRRIMSAMKRELVRLETKHSIVGSLSDELVAGSDLTRETVLMDPGAELIMLDIVEKADAEAGANILMGLLNEKEIQALQAPGLEHGERGTTTDRNAYVRRERHILNARGKILHPMYRDITAGIVDEYSEDEADLSWQSEAVCGPDDQKKMLPTNKAASEQGKELCQTCPVITICLDTALEHGFPTGIWGGTSYRDRVLIKKEYSQHPIDTTANPLQ